VFRNPVPRIVLVAIAAAIVYYLVATLVRGVGA